MVICSISGQNFMEQTKYETDTPHAIQTDVQTTIPGCATKISYLNSAEGSQDMVVRSISGENSIGQTKYGYRRYRRTYKQQYLAIE